eukprot:1160308-Pelagomonas_calceolata.AAC.9
MQAYQRIHKKQTPPSAPITMPTSSSFSHAQSKQHTTWAAVGTSFTGHLERGAQIVEQRGCDVVVDGAAVPMGLQEVHIIYPFQQADVRLRQQGACLASDALHACAPWHGPTCEHDWGQIGGSTFAACGGQQARTPSVPAPPHSSTQAQSGGRKV